MNRRWLVATVALALAAGACNLVMVYNTEVHWALSGQCSDYNVDQWEVSLSGPEMIGPLRFDCSGPGTWSTGPLDVEEGAYFATVRAISPSGQTLATKQGSGAIISSGLYIDVGTFTASDFHGSPDCGNGACQADKGETCSTCALDCGACPTGASVHVFWVINDTVDGTDTGLSWDTCTEVGAASLQLSVDGTKQTLACGGGDTSKMNQSITVTPGTHTFTATLVDSSNTPLTVQSQAVTLQNLSSSNPGELLFVFMFSDFLEPRKSSTLGNFLFTTAFEGGKTCAQVPYVTNEISLLKLSGAAVTPAPQVCDLANTCYPADGNTLGKCSNPTETMTIKQLKWGAYKLLLQGVNPTKHACFSVQDPKTSANEVDILVGAGDVNPIVKFDMKRIDSTAACQ